MPASSAIFASVGSRCVSSTLSLCSRGTTVISGWLQSHSVQALQNTVTTTSGFNREPSLPASSHPKPRPQYRTLNPIKWISDAITRHDCQPTGFWFSGLIHTLAYSLNLRFIRPRKIRSCLSVLLPSGSREYPYCNVMNP